MMSKTKFRVWDHTTGKMHYQEYALLQDGNCLYYDDFGAWTHCGEEQPVVMLNTGLQDKNGKEIFEGDIIKKSVECNQEYHGNYCYEEIIKKRGQWLVSHLKAEKGSIPRGYLVGFLLDAFEYDRKLFMFSDDYRPSTEIEVIGNVYENKDLMGE